MFQYLIRRSALSILIVFGAMLLLFGFIQLIPGDPATIMLGPRATPELIAEYKQKMGLDQSVIIQFARFISGVFQGDLGTCVLTHRPVSARVIQVLPNSIILAFSSIFVASLFGIPLGIYSAAYRGSIMDRITGFLSISLITIPAFLKGLILLLVFSVILRWFPARGAGEAGNILDQLWHLILPMLAIALGWVGYIARLMRSTTLEELTKDHVRTAKAKGTSQKTTIYKHAARGALIPVIAALGVGFGNLLGGQVLIEIVFHRPGIGSLIYQAITTRNYPVVQGGLIVAVFMYVIVNMIADISHGFLDPRIRYD